MTERDRELWEQDRRQYVQTATERDEAELRDLDLGVIYTQEKMEKLVKRRVAAQVRLRSGH